MFRTPTAAALLLALAVALAVPATAEATFYRGRAVVARPGYAGRPTYYAHASTYYRPNHHLPGWDWRRTYPYSWYNYGRNPYNPIVVPYYYYPQPYPVPVPYYPSTSSSYVTPTYNYSTTPAVPTAPVLNLPQPPAPPAVPPLVIGG